MKFQRLTEVGQCFFFRLTLAGYIDFEKLGDEPISFTPNGGQTCVPINSSSANFPCSTNVLMSDRKSGPPIELS